MRCLPWLSACNAAVTPSEATGPNQGKGLYESSEFGGRRRCLTCIFRVNDYVTGILVCILQG